jgi:ribonuclease D
LIQVATDHRIALIDTLQLNDLMPFWRILTEGDHVTAVHAAREEFLFCHRASKSRPKKLFDVQMAAGFVGHEYPAAYVSLVQKLLGKHLTKVETRTDWSRRPLSEKQIGYAVQDVMHLRNLHQCIASELNRLHRRPWYEEEIANWMSDLEFNETELQWQRVSGVTKLNRRALGILVELFTARDAEAKHRNRSPKRILADDLMIELAVRGNSSTSGIRAIRGLEQRVSPYFVNKISEAIRRGNDIDEASLPNRLPRGETVHLGLLGQFLTTIVHVVCRDQNIAPSLVGTSQQIRELAAWKLGIIHCESLPEMARGWRAEIIGMVVERALRGEISLRIGNPSSGRPLVIDERKS